MDNHQRIAEQHNTLQNINHMLAGRTIASFVSQRMEQTVSKQAAQ